MIQFAYKPSCPSSQSLLWFLRHEVTRNISTPPGWDFSSLQGYPSIKLSGTHLYTRVERGTARVNCFAQEHNTMQCPWPGLEPRPINLEMSALTMRPPCLPLTKYSCQKAAGNCCQPPQIGNAGFRKVKLFLKSHQKFQLSSELRSH